MLSKSYRFNLVLILIILANIVNMIYPKGMGYEEHAGGMYEVSKYLYGGCIMLMFPSLFSKKRFYFSKMRYMTYYVMLHIVVAVGLSFIFEMGEYLKTLMICLSFIFFEDVLPHIKINKYLLSGYILSIFVNIVYLTMTQNRLEMALENMGHVVGGQGIATSMAFLLPLIFYRFSEKVSPYLFLIGAVAVFVSMRRTAMLAYLLCIPFIYKQLLQGVSKKMLFLLLIAMVLGGYYIYTHYWFVMEDRFSDTFEASESGYYGSGRTGWWEVLIVTFWNTPFHWLQGFGVGKVAEYMANAGFPFGNAHNDYLEVGFTYGIVGLYLWFGSIWDLYKLSAVSRLKRYSPLVKMGALSYLFVALVSGATEQPHFMCIALFASLMLVETKYPSYNIKND